MRLTALLVSIVSIVFLGACSGGPSKADCSGIVDHLIDIFTAGKSGDDNVKVNKEYLGKVEDWRKVLKDDKDPTREALMEMCTTQMSSSAASCIIASKNDRELAACLGG